MIPIFFGFSLDIIIVASGRNPAIRTGLDLKAGNSSASDVASVVASAGFFRKGLGLSIGEVV